MKFSIIIPARKISDYLKENIYHLKKLEYQNFEVLIVTDTQENFDFSGDERFILLNSNNNGNPSLKRNIAASKATGEILAFLDDDAYPRSDWLNEAAKIFSDPKIYALGGPAVTPLDAGLLEKASGYILQSKLASGNTTYRHIPQEPRDIDDYPSVNLFVKKSSFDAVGGFGLEFWPGEDTKLCLDLIKYHGQKFKYDPKPLVYHHRRSTLKAHLKQVSRYGQHRGLYARVFPENSRIPAYFIPSFFVIGFIFGPLTKLFSMALYKIYLGVMAIYIFMLIYKAFVVYLKEKNTLLSLYVLAGTFMTHLVYGANFMIGFIKRPKLKLKAVDTKSGNYSEG